MLIRVFDIFFSLLALLCLSPILVFVAFILKLTGEGYVFYVQTRIGQKGVPFSLVKFATMLKDSPNLGGGFVTVKNDERILPFGNLLRLTKINELPQLINVLKGDMSLVGTRPIVPDQFESYSNKEKQALYVLKPGLTGLGSIVFRNEEALLGKVDNPKEFHSHDISEYKLELAKWYSENCSVMIYFGLIFLTCWIVINPASKIVWRIFPSIPRPSKRVELFLGLSE